ncbi:MAG: hypothetical protein AAFP19_11750 [Bacteroidota bacterium]
MSDTLDPISIQSPEEALSPALNYQNLRNIGLDTIIQTGSDNWTDYNAHDPGMTILEMLIYTLTDLAYRTDFPIEDIIAQQQLSNEQLAKNQFYTARDILTTNAVNFNDLRKFLIDQKGVGNAWVQNSDAPLNTFGGLINIFVDPFPAPNNEEASQQLINQIERAYHSQRNLGQDLGQVILRQPLDILLNMDLIISPNAIVEVVLAQVLFTLENQLSSTVDFLSLQEMMEAVGGEVNQAFNGPPLMHGFLPDRALLPMINVLRAMDLIPIISKIPDVVLVSVLEMRTLAQQEAAVVKSMGTTKKQSPKQGKWFKQISIPEDQKPQLAHFSQHRFRIQKGETPSQINWMQLEFELKKLRSQKRVAKLAPQKRDFPIPKGNYRDINRYYSIQQEFPRIYGLDPAGPPPGASNTQLGQINQLKAYLLIFDQLMANYLAQLAKLGQLFSWDKTISRTYFFQGLENAVNQLSQLLVTAPIDSHSKREQVSFGPSQIMAQYQSKLAEFREDEPTFLSRRNRFLDHLLARFGRNLTTYVEGINQQTLAKQQQVAMETKLRVLDQYTALSAQRARAYNQLEAHHFTNEFSGLRRWVETLFDMQPESRAVYHFNKRFVQGIYHAEEKSKYVFSQYILATKDGSKVDLKELMRIGGNKENYRVDFEPKKGHHILLYKITQPDQPAKVYTLTETYESAERTLEVIDELAYLMGEYDKTSERIYLVEHLLLRPTPIEYYFGLALLDENGNPWMQTQKWYPQTTLDQILSPPNPNSQFYYCIKDLKACSKKVIDKEKSTIDKKVKKTITAKYQFSIKAIDPNAPFVKYQIQLQFGETGSTITLSSTNPYESKEIAVKAIKQWINRLKKSFSAPNGSTNAASLWKPLLRPWIPSVKKPGPYKTLLADPYSFALTVVIPNWPSRFQKKGFKKSLERAIRTECPAHLWPNILWLGKNKFQQFQNLHLMWWNAYTQNEPDAYAYRKELMAFIMKYSLPKHLRKQQKAEA